MRDVLVIRSARADVLRGCLERMPEDARITLLGTPVPGNGAVRCVAAPAGPLSWQRLDGAARAALRATRWSEIVMLHNLGDEDYAEIIALARRTGPLTPFRIYYADGVERRYRTVLALAVRRAMRSLAATAVLGVVMLIALPVAAARTRRS